MIRMFLLLCALLVLPVDALAGEIPIRIEGSTTMGPLMRRMVMNYRAVNPDQEFTLTASGSGDGLTAMAGGRADIAMASRLIEGKEVDRLRARGIDPERVLVALDGLAVVVHRDNPVSGLDLRQLQAIYAGGVENWKDFGGPDMAVVPFERESSSGSHDVWVHLVMGMSPVYSEFSRVASNEAMARMVREEPGSIGYVGLGFVDSRIRLIEVDGITATEATVASGTYPLSRTLNLYIPKDAPVDVRRFVEFVLGPEGRRIVEDSGFVPIP